jgi:hypothetical protein
MTTAELGLVQKAGTPAVSHTASTVQQQCGTGPKDYGCIKTVDATTPLIGATIKDGSALGLGTATRQMFVSYNLGDEGSTFQVQLPEIEINGTLQKRSTATFSVTTGVVWTAMCS